MIHRPRKHLLLPLLASGLTLALGTSLCAAATSASLQINFGTTPHWTSVTGTRVEEIRDGERPNYDMFRYGGTYYVYNNDRWYSSNQERGQFNMIDDNLVPGDFSRIPRDHWRSYPTRWTNQNSYPQYGGTNGTSASLQINFGRSPTWTNVYGTRVEEIRSGERPSYDMFRYGGTYYVYNNDRWYSSNQERGQFDMIDDRLVPSDFSRIPRDHWRSYPSAWANQGNDSRYQGSRGTSGSLQISFGNRPRWSSIYGTRVQMIGGSQYPDYDVFRYGGSYYAFNNDRWYMSRRANGQFNLIDDRYVPSEFTRIPRHQWHNYPSAWMDQNGNSRYENNWRRNNRGRYAQPAGQRDNN